MNKVNIKDSQNFITSKYHIEKIMNLGEVLLRLMKSESEKL